MLEGFEGAFGLDYVANDGRRRRRACVRTTSDVRSGSYAALFSFGKETNMGIRGFYRSGGSGFIPAVASSSFVETTGASRGSGLLVRLTGGIVPIVITDVVEHFPTLDPAGRGFLVFDVESLLSYMDALNPHRRDRHKRVLYQHWARRTA